MTELRDCPFCGEPVSVVSGWTNRDGRRVNLVRVQCYACDASGPTAQGDNLDGLEGEAARLWNTRSYDGLVGELGEATELAAGRITDMMDSFDCYDPKDIEAVQRLRTALTRAREAGYTTGDPDVTGT